VATKKTRLKLDIKKLLLIPNNGSHSAGTCSPENQVSSTPRNLPVGLEVLEDLVIQEGLEFPNNIMK